MLVENYSYTRAEASLKGGIITWLIGLGTIWSFNYGQDYTVFGMTFFGILDAFTSKVLLPLGGLMMAIFVGYIVKKNTTSKELNLSNGLFSTWRLLIRFLAPIAVTFIFVNGFIN